MALIAQRDAFDPDSWPAPVLGIAAELANHDSKEHCHRRAQLLYSSRGCMTVTLSDRWLILPPTRCLWIPGWDPASGTAARPGGLSLNLSGA
jgi:hypothetical protein